MSSRTIAILGSAGQLGRDLSALLGTRASSLTRADADLTDAAQLRKVLMDLKPAVVVNCAAYNFVDKAETEPEQAFAINALAPRQLASLCTQLDIQLVQFSTDYVFGLDEERTQPYLESDPAGPVSVYGVSKLSGELFVRASGPRHLILRTCGLYGVWGSGGKGTNFVETMLRLAGQGKPLKVVADQLLTPSYTADIAAATRELIDAGCTGLYHVSNAGACSWLEFARTIFEMSGVKADLTSTTSKEYNSPARRPAYSVLGSERMDRPTLRPWREALAAYLAERTKRR